MAQRRRRASFPKLWRDYLKACEEVAAQHRQDHRLGYLAATVSFQRQALSMARSPASIGELQRHWKVLQAINPQAAIALQEELQSYPNLARAATAADNLSPDQDPAERRRALLGIAGIVSGSVKDLFEDLPPIGRQMLTILRELWDMLKEV
jgi:hypothetical protein